MSDADGPAPTTGTDPTDPTDLADLADPVHGTGPRVAEEGTGVVWPDPATEVDDLPPVAFGVADMTALLRSVGIRQEEIAEARRHRHLELLAIEHLVLPDVAEHDLEGLAAATGLSAGQITRIWRSLGFAEPRPGDRVFTDVDVDMLRTIAQFLDMGMIDDELTIQMSRVIGSSLARVASALIDSVDPAEPREPDGEGLWPDDDEFAAAAPLLLPTLLQVMDYVWRRHVQVEARARIAREHSAPQPDHRVVGFADLVGFTALSQQVTAHELARVVDRFEGIAYDTIGSLGGRVVKMIGDEVMFAVGEERAAAEIALTLSETYRDDDELSDVRVALAAGQVLQREADLFGPVVNRASRVVNLAFPGTVVCSGEVHDALVGDPAFAWRSIGSRNLKGIGRIPLHVLRRTSEPEPERSVRERAQARRAERREAMVVELTSRRERNRKDRGTS